MSLVNSSVKYLLSNNDYGKTQEQGFRMKTNDYEENSKLLVYGDRYRTFLYL